MNVKAYAKINLSLDITGRREDGYHLLRMVMQTLSLCDDIEIEKNSSGDITLSCDKPGIPTDDKNLMCKAAYLMKEKYGITEGFDMKLIKRIPSEAGLGGGSADAAAVLRAVNELCELGLPNSELQKISVKIGADVPFLVEGGTALCEGIGEILTSMSGADLQSFVLKELLKDNDCTRSTVHNNNDHMGKCIGNTCRDRNVSDSMIPKYTILVKPDKGVDTKKIYNLYDKYIIKNGKPKNYKNVLEPITASIETRIPIIKDELINLGAAYTAMSGSGTTVFGLFYDEKKLHIASEYIKNAMPDTITYETSFFG